MDISLLFLLFPQVLLLGGLGYVIYTELREESCSAWPTYARNKKFKAELQAYVRRYNHDAFARDMAHYKMLISPSHLLSNNKDLSTAASYRNQRYAYDQWMISRSPLHKLSRTKSFQHELQLKAGVKGLVKCLIERDVKASPMRQLATQPGFQAQLAERYAILQDRYYYLDYMQSYVLPQIEPRSNIILSSKFRRLLRCSIIMPVLAANARLNRMQKMDQSPMRNYIKSNVAELNRMAWAFKTGEGPSYYNHCVPIMRLQSAMCELASTYGERWQPRLETMRHCLEQSVPIVKLMSGHNTRIVVTANGELPCLSSIEGLDHHILHLSKGVSEHVYISSCPSKNDRKMIINAAHALNDIIFQSEPTVSYQIQALSNAEHIGVLEKVQHQATITLIRRSKALFTEGIFNKCQAILDSYLKKYNDELQVDEANKIHMQLSSMDGGKGWLSGVLQIRLNATGITALQFRRATTDLIPMLNMIKDVIFASRTTEVCWISLSSITSPTSI